MKRLIACHLHIRDDRLTMTDAAARSKRARRNDVELAQFMRKVCAQRNRVNALGDAATGAELLENYQFLTRTRQALRDACNKLDAFVGKCAYCDNECDVDAPNYFCPSCCVCSDEQCTSPCDRHPSGSPDWNYTECETCGHYFCSAHMTSCQTTDTSLCFDCHRTAIDNDACSCS